MTVLVFANMVCQAQEVLQYFLDSDRIIALPSATIAQLVEHLIRNERVVGSNPISSSIVLVRLPSLCGSLYFLGHDSLSLWYEQRLLQIGKRLSQGGASVRGKLAQQ